MRQSNQIDLRTASGARTVTIEPGESVVYQFNAQQSRIGAGGGGKPMYNYIRGIVLKLEINLSQPAEGTQAPIPSDLIYGALGSLNLNSPLFGTLIDPAVMQNGHLAKHLMEFFGLGYQRAGVDRSYVPGTVGATFNVYAELYIPISQAWNEWQDTFAHWLGWYDTAELEIFCSSSADPFAQTQLNPATTPVTLNNVTISATLDMVPWGQIIIPPVATWRQYYQPASSDSNGPTLIGVGNNGALQGTDDQARLVAMLFSHNAGGFTGSGTADQINTLTLPWRDQQQTLVIDGLFARFLRDAHMEQYGGSAVSATAPIAQVLDLPEPYSVGTQMGAPNCTVPLANQYARYTPLVWPSRNQQISHQQRVKGNYPLDMTFSAGQTGQFRIYTLELKQFSISKVAEMLAAMGVDPTSTTLVPKFGNKNVKVGATSSGTPVTVGAVAPKKTFCLPRQVMINPKS